MGIEAAVQFVRSVGETAGNIAFRNCEFTDEVGLELFMHECACRIQCGLGVNHRGQRFEINRHVLCGIQRLVAAFRHDHGDGLADMPHLVHREQWLLRQVDRVLDLGSPLARQRHLSARNRWRYPIQIGAGKD